MTPSHETLAEAVPKLTKPQMARLVEIGMKFPKASRSGSKPATTDALRTAKCIRQAGGKQWGNGWLTRPELSLTPIGIRVLAGLPGDEFDRFRDLLAGHIAIDTTPGHLEREDER